MRTIIELPESQVEALTALCRRERISRAEAIRRAVSRLLDDEQATAGGMAGAFGLWKDRADEARKLRADLREEWR
jgi:metal-responsive CopG/Arc/MetJ family transcriptional regulator